MDSLYSILGWGSPLGIGLFLMSMGIGGGVFFWGLAQLNKTR